jgi:predicted signal transduction protein with EAL and GGDEF domain
MLAMARASGLDVVAEGVETAEHLAALRSLGCATPRATVQPPGAEAEIEELLAGRSAARRRAAAGRAGAPGAVDDERLTRTLLAELQRVTGSSRRT